MAETAVILVQWRERISSSIFAERILHILAMGGNPDRVGLSVTPTLAIGACLIACGAVLRLQCYHALGRHFTFETGIFKNHKLVILDRHFATFLIRTSFSDHEWSLQHRPPPKLLRCLGGICRTDAVLRKCRILGYGVRYGLNVGKGVWDIVCTDDVSHRDGVDGADSEGG